MVLKETIFKIQSEVSKVHKDGANPHTRSNYPTLESVLDTLNEVIQTHSLVITQFPQHKDYGWVLTTEISTADGKESHQTECPLLGLDEGRNKMQALGSALTYARRYALMAIFKLAPTDDDAASLTVVQEKRDEPAKPKNYAPGANKQDLKIEDGKYKGKWFTDIPPDELRSYIAKIDAATKAAGKQNPKWFLDLKKAAGL